MSDYRLLVDVDVLEFLRTLRQDEQEAVLKRLRAIASFPENHRSRYSLRGQVT